MVSFSRYTIERVPMAIPSPDKHNFNHIAFIGWENDGYNLFMYRQMSTDSVRLSQGLPMLAPVLFRQTRRYPECDGVP